MSYIKTNWINNNAPAINQTNLNKIEQGIKDLETKITTVTNSFNSLKTAGEIIAIGNNIIPQGWLLCDGSEVSKTTYSQLYNVIGDLWGTPGTSTNFILPNLTHKTFFAQNTADTNFTPIGKSGGALGAWYHAHTAYQDSHRHTSHNNSGVAAKGSLSAIHSGSSNSTSSAQPGVTIGYAGSTNNQQNKEIANMPPYAVIKYIICTGK